MTTKKHDELIRIFCVKMSSRSGMDEDSVNMEQARQLYEFITEKSSKPTGLKKSVLALRQWMKKYRS